jgi:hypothetical protein
MSALDHKQTFSVLFGMSGLPLKADFLIARPAILKWPLRKINAMPLVEMPVNVNHVLILSNPLTSYHRPRPPLAKLFVASWRLVMGASLGDKVVIVIALLLLAVVAVVCAEFPGIIRAARLVAAL